MDLALQRRDLYRFHGGIQVKLFEGEVDDDGDTKTSDPKYVMPFKEGTFFLNVTAKAGTSPTLDVHILTKHPMQDQWEELVAFTQVGDALTSEMKAVAANLGDVIAVDWVKGGTDPVYTIVVTAVLKVF